MPKLTDYAKTAEAAEILGVSQNTLCKNGPLTGRFPFGEIQPTVTGCSCGATWMHFCAKRPSRSDLRRIEGRDNALRRVQMNDQELRPSWPIRFSNNRS